MNEENLKAMILQPLESLKLAIKNLNRHVESDPDSRIFKEQQIRKLFSGNASNSLKQIDNSEFSEEVLNWFSPNKSHLAVLRAQEVGCHSSELQSSKNLSALMLHQDDGLCQRCPTEHNPDFTSAQINPYQCWRRGQRSSNFGFLYNLTLQIDDGSGKWALSPSKRLKVAFKLQLSLNEMEHNLSSTLFGNDFISLGRNMMIVLRIKLNNLVVSDGSSELSSLLQTQLLSSRHMTSRSSETKSEKGSTEELRNVVETILRRIDDSWEQEGVSKNSRGILSAAVLYTDSKDSTDLFQSILEGHVRSKEWAPIAFKELDNDLKKAQYGFEKQKNALRPSEVAICLFMDPILDLGVDSIE